MLTRWSNVTAYLLPLLLCGQAMAQDDEQFRRIQLSDGTTIHAQVLSTDNDGLLVETGSGERTVLWADVLDLVEIERDEYQQNSRALITYWGSSSKPGSATNVTEASDGFKKSLAAVPAFHFVDSNELFRSLPSRQQNDLLLCEVTDAECLAPMLAETNLDSYFFGVFDEHNGSARASFFRIKLKGDNSAKNMTLSYPLDQTPSEQALHQVAWTLLEEPFDSLPEHIQGQIELAVQTPPEPRATPPSEPSIEAESNTEPMVSAPEEPHLTANLWIPVPAYPALKRQDKGTLIISSASVGLLTAAGVYFAGGVGLSVPWNEEQAQWANPAFLGGLGAVTYGVTSIASNHFIQKVLYKRR